ncbi:hypothetical protein SH1V18_47790 [Vallitalea longa]|uniref:Uncharacterized protein n=1 Tax=Vallitalea longa TaxID=2936439 RepID=A0A9W6DIV6_9FIRM|nr:hypothetical protein [Vallitalea longa]GKX32299.1 hypothetical protein SH1V18_47790 [Vallitalea longa]
MNIFNVAIKIIGTVIVLAITIYLVELFIPFGVEREFAIINEQYKNIALERGGLTKAEKNSLQDELEKMDNINNLAINITSFSTRRYKEKITYDVKATYSYSTLMSLLSRKLREVPLRYERKFPNRKIIN